MGGFIGGVVHQDKRLAPAEFETIVSSIQRRGAGSAFHRILDPDSDSQSVVYLASAQDSGFTENGVLAGEPPVTDSFTLIDGFPTDRSISELENRVASQRTVLHNGDPAFIDRLIDDNGPFVFAAANRHNTGITLSRDYLGRKTIYYYASKDELWFASDLPALLALKRVPRRPNPATVYHYLRHARWNNNDQTLFSDIFQLPPGGVLNASMTESDLTLTVTKRAFTIPVTQEIGFHDSVIATRNEFLRAIELCLPMNQLPIGASLSGGIDSSAIVAAMRAVAGPEREIHTFSFIIPGHEKINEEPWIDIAAKSVNSVSHKLEVDSNEFARDLPTATLQFGEPLIGASQYLQFRLGSLIRDSGLTNVIDGVLGDSVTAGSDSFIFDRLRKAVGDRDIKASGHLARTMVRQLLHGQSRAYYVQALAQLPAPLHSLIRRAAKLEAMPHWIDRSWFLDSGVSGSLPTAATGNSAFQQHVLSAILGSAAVRSSERNASTHACNSGHPFLSSDFVQHMLSLPDHYHYGNDGQKRISFLAAMKPFVPDEILSRTDKVGFNAPDNVWLAEQRDWANQILSRAKELNVPIRLDRIPEDIAEQKVNRSDIIRCLSLTVWADSYEISF